MTASDAVEIVNAEGHAPLLLVCEHASRRVPEAWSNLGLADHELERHIGWDIGAAAVSRHLARLLDAPAILAGYSRLFLDCNRRPGAPDFIPAVSDGTVVPGNRDIDAEDVRRRIEAVFTPLHAAIARRLDLMTAHRGRAPAMLAMHSFTPVMAGTVRPWNIGVLWNQDERIATPLLAALRDHDDIEVGANEPYSGRSRIGYTLWHHAEPRMLPHAAIEIRQDGLALESQARAWAERLAEPLRGILGSAPTWAAAEACQ